MPETLRTCYRHPDQRAGVVCQRCDRPICPRCMHQASVGFHCPECVKQGRQRVIRGPGALRAATPILTYVLIAINVAAYVAGVVWTGGSIALSGGSDKLIQKGGLIASMAVAGPSNHVCVTSHAVYSACDVVGVAHGEWYRVITSGFLHYGIIHIGLNMVALYFLGMIVERVTGRWQFGLIYAVSLLAGSFGALLVSPNALTAGASGAIFGLFGAVFAAARARGIAMRQTGLAGWLVADLAFTFLIPGISVGGHVGGLVGGFLAGLAMLELPNRLKSWPRPARLAAGASICVALGVLCFVGALALAAGHSVPT
jgi:membrane associated rhomboid family serine protease